MGNSKSKATEVLPSVLHITHLLDEKVQLQVLAATQACESKLHVEVQKEHSHYFEILSIDLDTNTDQTETFRKLLKSSIKHVRENIKSFPEAEEFHHITGYSYPVDGKLTGHVDSIQGWIVIIGLGLTANFWVQKDNQEKVNFKFASGDILAFNTSAASGISHGIEGLDADSRPSFFPPDFNQRISLQFRQSIAKQILPHNTTLSSANNNNHNNNNNKNNNNNTPKISPSSVPIVPLPEGFFITKIPIEVIWHIVSFLDLPSMLRMSATCHAFSNVPSPIWQMHYVILRPPPPPPRPTPVEPPPSPPGSPGVKLIKRREPQPNEYCFTPSLPSTTPKKLVKAEYVQQIKTKRDSILLPAINIDNGSYKLRGGFCGDDGPSAALYTEFEGKFPIRNRLVYDFDTLGKLWETMFIDKLSVTPSEQMFLGQISYVNPTATREKLTQMAFEQFGIAAWYLGTNEVLSLYASGKTTGVVVDIGYESTTISPIYEGYSLLQYCKTYDVGGNHVTKRFKDLVVKKHPQLELSMDHRAFESLKEKVCVVKTLDAAIPPVDIGEGCMVDEERHKPLEVFFDANAPGESFNLVDAIRNVINDNDQDVRKDLWQNIVICGGGSKAQELATRLKTDCNNGGAPRTYEARIHTVDGEAAWLGGSILGSLSTFPSMWISSHEYYECGPSIVNRKCF